jgi:hypothetical protein
LLAQVGQEEAISPTPNVDTVAPLLWDLPALLEVATPLERNAVYRGIINRVWVEPHKITALTPTRSYEAMLVAASELIRHGGPGGHTPIEPVHGSPPNPHPSPHIVHFS